MRPAVSMPRRGGCLSRYIWDKEIKPRCAYRERRSSATARKVKYAVVTRNDHLTH